MTIIYIMAQNLYSYIVYYLANLLNSQLKREIYELQKHFKESSKYCIKGTTRWEIQQ